MSLIIDALKRAQQLRLKGPKGPSILNYPPPDKTRRRSFKKQWGLIAAGLISLSIILAILLRPTPSPLATQTNHTMVVMEKIPSIPVAEKISQEPPRERLSLPKDMESVPTAHVPNPAGSGTASGQALNRAGTGQARAGGLSYAEAALTGRPRQSTPSPSQRTQKEEVSSKSIGVEQEGEKDRTLTSDVLNHFNSGVTFYNQKEFSKAIQAYQKVIELDPTYVEAYNNMGIVYQMLGNADRAFGAYQKATEINPRYEKGYNNLGILLLLKGRYEEALGSFQKALAVNPDNIEAHINLGILYKKKGQWEKAIESYQKALAIDPLHRETHYNIALLYEQLENLELAISHYQQFIQLSSKSHPELVLQVKRHLHELTKTKNK